MQNDFLPDGYEQPKSSANYLKLEKGENKFRILSKPIVGWIDWDNKKPVRFKMNQKPEKPFDASKPVKHFWAFVVWSYKNEAIQIIEITQSSIQAAITALTKDSDWGSPFEYDIKIMKTGEGKETEYTVNPVPHRPVSAEIKKAFESKPVKLELLFEGADPFVATVPAGEDDDMPLF